MKKILFTIAFISLLSTGVFTQTRSDLALRRVTEQDEGSRDAQGKLVKLTAQEHLTRAEVYMKNRQFPEAREHWQIIVDNYADDSLVMPKTLFGIARSYMWEREYDKAVFWFDRLAKDYPNTKDGREGLAYKGASLVRANKNLEASEIYKQYANLYPTGEKIESAYLNLIDTLRESGKYDEANIWVENTRKRFSDTPTETNALQARLRMEIYRQNWTRAVEAADDLLKVRSFYGSMTSADETKYLKAFALEKAGRKPEAVSVYASIPDSLNSYYGGLASDRLSVLSPNFVKKTAQVSSSMLRDYPAPYRAEILRYAKSKGVDPRFVLAIMKQESSFRPQAKSPAAARGLLQLVYDTALKYNEKAGFPDITGESLYVPRINIAIGAEYIADLKNQFDGVYEAIAASYNGGEDNAARWLNRSKPKEPAIFASEVGFSETKNYVFKVMNNYRVYRELYTEDLFKK